MFKKEEVMDYLNKLANGIDPKDDTVLPDDTILNRADVIRMLFAAKKYLSEAKSENNIKTQKVEKIPFKLTTTEGIVEKVTTISKLVRRINETNCTDNMKPLRYRAVNAWLIKEGYLSVDINNKKVPTDKGLDIGLSKVLYTGRYGGFYVVEYNEQAQRFVLENIMNGNINPEMKDLDDSDTNWL